LLWPRFIFPRLLPNGQVPPKARLALDLIGRDPAEYARRFHSQLLIFRLSGAVALMIALIAVVLAVLSAVFVER